MALKVGIVGLNGIGKNHAKCHTDEELSDLVAVCDVVHERADEVAKEYNLKAYYSLQNMLDAHPDLDIVDVCTGGLENGSWHYKPAMEAMEAGKHTLVEKPLSHDIGEAREMVAKAAEKDVYLGCNLNHYFTQPADKAKEYIAEGKVGEQVYCLHKMGFNGGAETYARAASPRADFPYFHMKAFLTHPFAVMRYFCGDITHIQTFVNRPSFRRAASDPMVSINSIHVRFANDAVGYLLSQRGDATFGLGGWWSFELAGTQGTFCIENCVEKMTYWPAPKPEQAGSAENMDGGEGGGPEVFESGTTDFNETFPNRIHAFMEDIQNAVPKEQLRSSGRDALAALEYTWAAMESYEQGGILVRPNPLPPLHGDPITMQG